MRIIEYIKNLFSSKVVEKEPEVTPTLVPTDNPADGVLILNPTPNEIVVFPRITESINFPDETPVKKVVKKKTKAKPKKKPAPKSVKK